MITTLVVVGWAVCGFLTFGLLFAGLQRHWRLIADEWRGRDFRFALVIAIGGPFGLVATLIFLCMTSWQGFKYNFKPEGITWEEYTKQSH